MSDEQSTIVLAIPKETVIYGYKGSTAESYALKYNRTFSSLDETIIKKGDVDSDGDVSIVDATTIQRFVAKTIVLSDSAFVAGDVNSDGDITITDATNIQRFVAKIIEEF